LIPMLGSKLIRQQQRKIFVFIILQILQGNLTLQGKTRGDKINFILRSNSPTLFGTSRGGNSF
jgi:hypothetical protein